MEHAFHDTVGDIVPFLVGTHGFAQQARAPEPNTLSAEEKAQGFELLFDGKSLSAFDVPAGDTHWSILNGAIKSNADAGAHNMLTREVFTNFILKAEFRADPNVHAHILLRRAKAPARGGYEFQIKDYDPRKTIGDFLTASVPGVAVAKGARILPGVWNTAEITFDGDHLRVVYNGRQVIDARDSQSSSGSFALSLATPQDAPGHNIEFRNLKVKRLP